MITKVAAITCYKDFNYVRIENLRNGLKACSDIELIVVKNQQRNLLRYFEILYKLISLRVKQKPDVYLLTFRGQEILWLVLLIAGKKPVIFDELIVPVEYVEDDLHPNSLKNNFKAILSRVSQPVYGFMLRRCALILSDTEAHAELSAKASQVNLRQYVTIPIGADESISKALNRSKNYDKGIFGVFFYGKKLPLDELEVILEAATQLNKQPQIKFNIVGGGLKVVAMVDRAIAKGAHIEYQKSIAASDLGGLIRSAGICLSGPFASSSLSENIIAETTFQFMASSVPTIVGQNEVSRKFFKDKSNSLVIGQDNPVALAQAIKWAADNRSKLSRLGRAGRGLYDKKFSHQVITRQLQTIFNEKLSD